MKKKNLLSFSEDFLITEKLHRPGDYWRITKLSKPEHNISFESSVIDSIINWKEYRVCPEYNLLMEFFKKNGKLEDVQAFYNKCDQLKTFANFKGSELYYVYAKNVLKGRLPKLVEEKYLKNLWKYYYASRAIYKYAKYVIRGRLPSEFENNCNYIEYIDFLNSKGFDIGEVLINNSSLSYIFYKQYHYLPENVHHYMTIMQIAGDADARLYFNQRKKDDKIIKNRLKHVEQDKTVKDILENLL